MADLTIDTSSGQYTQLLAGLATLRTRLAPSINILRQLGPADQRRWVRRDPLLRRTIKLARSLEGILTSEGLDE